jgi:cytochrome c553
MLSKDALHRHDSGIVTNQRTRCARRLLLPRATLCLALLCAAALPSTAADAPSSAPATTSGFEDTIAQRTLACTACHGKEGRAAPDGYYPRIAGKPAGYLYNQLLNFRDGRRHYGLMTRMVDPLSDRYLLEIAEYFSALNLPYPAPQASQVSASVLERGRTLALSGDATSADPTRRIPACVQCHGAALTGVAPNIPGLLGLPRDYLNAQLGAWRTRQRQAHAPDCMAQIANRLSPEDVNAVTAWLAAQVVPSNAKPASALPALPAGATRIVCGSAPLPQTTAKETTR